MMKMILKIFQTIPPSFTITYVGTLSDIYPVEGLLMALNRLRSEKKDFVLRFVGSLSAKTKHMIISEIPESSLEFIPYTAHNEAIKYMMNSFIIDFNNSAPSEQ